MNINFRKLSIAAVTSMVFSACSTEPKKENLPSANPSYQGHGAVTVDIKMLQQFAPPVLPRSTASYVQNIIEANAPGLGILSPDGKNMYFSWGITGVSQVWHSDGPLKFPEQLTSGSEQTSVVDITPDGKYLIVTRDRSGEEDPGLYLMPAGGGLLVEIQHKKGVRTTYVWTANDSETVYFMANDIKPDSFALYSYSISTGQRELLFSDPGLWFVGDIRGDNHFLLGKRTGAKTREYYEWSRVNPVLIPVLGQSEKEEYDVKFGYEANHYLVLTAKFGEFKRLYDFSNGKFVAITSDKKVEIDDFLIDHRRFRLYINWNEGGLSKLEVRDPHNFRIITPSEIKDEGQIYADRPSRFGRFVSIGIESDTAPRTNFIFDWKERKFTQWVRSSVPENDSSHFVSSHLESYDAGDGTKIPMLVTRPRKCAADPCPVIVNFHGGPEGQSRPLFNKVMQVFVGAGFVFVEPNVRGSEGYGKSWSHADDGIKRLNVISDIEDCAKFIRSKWSKDGRAPKIGVMGGSYGGYSTLLAMTKYAGSYDAGVSIFGMSNLRTFLMNTAPYRRALRISEYGDPERDSAALEKLSPTSYLSNVQGPLLIIQGLSDPRVPVGEAIQIHELFKKRGVDSSLIIFSDEGHGSQKRDNRVLEIGNALLFFQQKMLPKINSSSGS